MDPCSDDHCLGVDFLSLSRSLRRDMTLTTSQLETARRILSNGARTSLHRLACLLLREIEAIRDAESRNRC